MSFLAYHHARRALALANPFAGAYLWLEPESGGLLRNRVDNSLVGSHNFQYQPGAWPVGSRGAWASPGGEFGVLNGIDVSDTQQITILQEFIMLDGSGTQMLYEQGENYSTDSFSLVDYLEGGRFYAGAFNGYAYQLASIGVPAAGTVLRKAFTFDTTASGEQVKLLVNGTTSSQSGPNSRSEYLSGRLLPLYLNSRAGNSLPAKLLRRRFVIIKKALTPAAVQVWFDRFTLLDS
jgi:hypothetical protein